jgi:hypothetical protein
MEAMQTGVENVIVQGWGGLSANSKATQQLLAAGTTTPPLNTGLYVLLNYYDAATNAFAGGKTQVDNAVNNLGSSALSNLKVIAIDVEPCAPCGEFESWKPGYNYVVKPDTTTRITDPSHHIQVLIKSGMSGPGPDTDIEWNSNKGGITYDGADGIGGAEWQNTGFIFDPDDFTNHILEIESAAMEAKAYTTNVIIYTSKAAWQQLTNSCDKTSCLPLISLPLWTTGGSYYAGDGTMHCGNGVAGLVPFTPFSANSWQSRSGNQFDLGPSSCAGENGLFGPGVTFDLDYFDPTLF